MSAFTARHIGLRISGRFGRRQQGVALIVALLLLVVITLVGLAAVRGTIMQQKMASNLYDRQIAFQSAEAAMRVAQSRIASYPAEISRNCQAGGIHCQADPFSDPNLPAGSIHDVGQNASGTATADFFTSSAVAVGQPQYVIENMGNWYDPLSSTGYNQTANSHSYNAQGASSTATYYRITARSSDPSTSGSRAVVTLQAMIKSN